MNSEDSNRRQARGQRRRFASLCILIALAGCAAFDPSLESQERFLCCNLFFNRDRDATDANYVYPDGRMVPLGTRMRVTRVGSNYVGLRPTEGTATFYLEHEHGREQLGTREYFERILVRVDPSPSLEGVPPDIAQAVRAGRIVQGMGREEVLLARGYPPSHRTPDLSANEWIYFTSRQFVDKVHFTEGKVDSITTAPAP